MIKYNRKGINYPSAKGEWKRLEKNNSRISFNMLKKKISILPTFHNTAQIKQKQNTSFLE